MYRDRPAESLSTLELSVRRRVWGWGQLPANGVLSVLAIAAGAMIAPTGWVALAYGAFLGAVGVAGLASTLWEWSARWGCSVEVRDGIFRAWTRVPRRLREQGEETDWKQGVFREAEWPLADISDVRVVTHESGARTLVVTGPCGAELDLPDDLLGRKFDSTCAALGAHTRVRVRVEVPEAEEPDVEELAELELVEADEVARSKTSVAG